MEMMIIKFFLLLFLCIVAPVTEAQLPRYKNPLVPVDERVKDLISRMTLEEKIGQMNMPCVYVNELGRDDQAKFEGCRSFAVGTREQGVGPGGGFFILAGTILKEGPKQQAEFINELQRIAVEKTRMQIPLLITEEGTHGLLATGATIFPEGLAIGSTWNMDLVRDIYSVAAREARAIGAHQLFTLVIEPFRDPRLGRNQEAYSEDPFLISKIAEAIVEGTQGQDISAPDKVVAGLCHFPGQSEAFGGIERGAMAISERTLREVYLPPWEAGIKKSGALGVMVTYPSIDGVPVHSSEKILTGILREELGFDGLVLGEGGGLSTLVYERIASSQKEAGELAIKAGVDVGISYEEAFMKPLLENVNEGRVSMAMIDRAVSRILKLKFRLGLFEKPYVDPDNAVKAIHTDDHQLLAHKTALESIILLKNENKLLPLKKDIRAIAIIGPNADNDTNQLGDYVTKFFSQDIITVREGIARKVSGRTRINYVKGCEIIGNGLNEISKAVKAAKNSDVAVVVLGEAGDRTNGEGHDVASLDLTGLQQKLLEAIHATGTPVVLVLINGRPLSVEWAANNIPAIVEAWMCGEKGGDAVADVLFGDYNPDGHLPVTFPRHVGQLPAHYNHGPSKTYWIEEGWANAYVDMSPMPLWEFGHGLSYTTFEYSNLSINPGINGPYGEFNISLEVRNIGDRRGADVVQLYINDNQSTVVRPVLELKGFEKLWLEPGEKKEVRFKITFEHLSMYDRNMNKVVEPGKFSVMIGGSSKDLKLHGSLEVK
jgi:beta-glucosidase